MKRILLSLILLALVFSFASCTVKMVDDYRLGGAAEDITSVDVYIVEKIDGSVLDIRDTSTPVHTIQGAQINEFIAELLAADYGNKVYFLAPIDYAHIFAPGYILFINYSDGTCDVYAEKGVYIHSCRYTADGSPHYNYYPHSYLGDISWAEFIEKYIHD